MSQRQDGGDSDLRPIPFNLPFIVGKELFYISQAVEEGKLDSDGRFTQMCTRWMEEAFSAKKVLLTHTCTAALEISAILSNVGPGDEVIMPSFTTSARTPSTSTRPGSRKRSRREPA